ncbi:DUF922 domain-containing protein [Lentilitoribacter sp. Alg239-R112]|nr:DUF922 domain-containing protein [Lentilitoribacter sp. Alg239-R112]
MLLTLGLLQQTSYAKTSFSKSYKYYEIGGTTIEDFWRNVALYGPRANRKFGVVGLTTFKLDIPYRYSNKNGKCQLTSVEIKLRSTISLPKWVDKSRSDKDMRIFWKALSGDVKRHEEKHVSIAESSFKALEMAILNIKPQRNCKALKKKINALSKQSERARNRAQNNFERDEIRGQKKRLSGLIELLRSN